MRGALTTYEQQQIVIEQAVGLAKSVYTIICTLEKEYGFGEYLIALADVLVKHLAQLQDE
ncbi:MAG: hypothetical protein KKB34_10275 [Bacteroidetes bacterium]|nr:hypothetical protein [Bacteroidota bacterium]